MTHQYTNKYYFMRHGESQANVEGIIVSNPKLGCDKYGLTEKGKVQVKNSVANFTGTVPDAIISSDFLRAKQTAEITSKILNLPAPHLNIGLRERWFGEFDGLSDQRYQDVWLNDEAEKSMIFKQVEPVEKVLKRGLEVLKNLEAQFSNRTLLLVSHGDMLQILRTAFSGLAAVKHRQLPHHQTAGILNF